MTTALENLKKLFFAIQDLVSNDRLPFWGRKSSAPSTIASAAQIVQSAPACGPLSAVNIARIWRPPAE